MKVRILYYPDKHVEIIHPVANSKKPGETEQEWLDRVFTKATPSGIDFDDVDSSTLPNSREYRNAWEGQKGQPVTINNTKKQKIKDKKEAPGKAKQKLKDLGLTQGEVDAIISG